MTLVARSPVRQPSPSPSPSSPTPAEHADTPANALDASLDTAVPDLRKEEEEEDVNMDSSTAEQLIPDTTASASSPSPSVAFSTSAPTASQPSAPPSHDDDNNNNKDAADQGEIPMEQQKMEDEPPIEASSPSPEPVPNRMQKIREATKKTAQRFQRGASYDVFADMFPTSDLLHHPFVRRGHDEIMHDFGDAFLKKFDEMAESTNLSTTLPTLDEKCVSIQRTAHWPPEHKVRHEVMQIAKAKKDALEKLVLEMETENRLLMKALETKRATLQEKEKQGDVLIEQLRKLGDDARKMPIDDMQRNLEQLKDVTC